ncbi:cell division protein FtsX [Gluconobacter morbifer]|uniref:Putative cell division protein FtsX n=1 Tax=Gluconobacter morbifer G707 TaxID=1088869 RepID=G6XKT8_9PROT|nr:FtsX-like permease family protein [Gluconobacter morbifer]EHH67651.1 putative cell division protein FtsX [Gluconobacter morbifer G707]
MSGPVSPGLRSGSLPVLVALMTLLAGLALAGLNGVQTLTRGWSQAARSAATIEIPDDTPQRSERTARLVQQLRALPAVLKVQQLSPEDVRKMLAPWLGQPADTRQSLPGLTLPSVLIVAHQPGLDLGRTVHDALPEASVEEDLRWSRRLERLGASLVGCAWLSVSLIAAIAVLSIGMTVRRSVSAQRKAVEIVHSLGASDGTISGRIALRAAWLSFAGGLAGLVLLTPVITLLANTLAPFTTFTSTGTSPPLLPVTLAGCRASLNVLPQSLLHNLVALPVLGAFLAWITAQMVVLVWLRRLP